MDPTFWRFSKEYNSHMLRATFLVALGWFIAAPLSAQAAPAPIVFDFEDGLQGWGLGGSAQRVQTQVLGGEWAIFGDGLVNGAGFIAMNTDITNIALISVEQFFVEGIEGGLLLALFGPGGDMLVENFSGAVESGNSSLRSVDVSLITGTRLMLIAWPAVFEGVRTTSIVAFIDNVTFHPVPEPSTLALLAFGLVALLIARRADDAFASSGRR